MAAPRIKYRGSLNLITLSRRRSMCIPALACMSSRQLFYAGKAAWTLLRAKAPDRHDFRAERRPFAARQPQYSVANSPSTLLPQAVAEATRRSDFFQIMGCSIRRDPLLS